jgi:hypothetical protein
LLVEREEQVVWIGKVDWNGLTWLSDEFDGPALGGCFWLSSNKMFGVWLSSNKMFGVWLEIDKMLGVLFCTSLA